MAMLIDGSWTGASDGAVDAVLNPATGEEIATVPRASAADVARAVAAAQAGAARMAALPAHRALRDPRGGGAADRGEPGGARRAALPRERQAHRRDDERGRGRGADLPRLCRGGQARLRPRLPARLHPGPRAVAGDHHAASRSGVVGGDRAVQLPGRALEPQGRRRARRRQRGDHQDAGGLPARGDRDQPLPRGGRAAARGAPARHRRAPRRARRWSRPTACRWSP